MIEQCNIKREQDIEFGKKSFFKAVNLNKEGLLDGRTFDVIVMSNVLHHIENPKEQLKILKTYLKPSGTIAIFDFLRDESTMQFMIKVHADNSEHSHKHSGEQSQDHAKHQHHSGDAKHQHHSGEQSQDHAKHQHHSGEHSKDHAKHQHHSGEHSKDHAKHQHHSCEHSKDHAKHQHHSGEQSQDHEHHSGEQSQDHTKHHHGGEHSKDHAKHQHHAEHHSSNSQPHTEQHGEDSQPHTEHGKHSQPHTEHHGKHQSHTEHHSERSRSHSHQNENWPHRLGFTFEMLQEILEGSGFCEIRTKVSHTTEWMGLIVTNVVGLGVNKVQTNL
eukprot:TRINITY_DN644_c0_g1_i1.p1 TRINITY_DN644_c0_g1~~TRINITY_DN644_c0_g1_i1.p1  ORF type:complete len:338 (-),score=49.45 TRINITY_DN644_c0_g1_i1:67-1053(-)